ncbi:antitoxin [Terrabacter carboxydivorans]|uniref:Antitoxin n=1 Tax=Terrabacter carboxydivorans TaxID=619730 RepID=A0ABP5YX04_9MICO
MSVFDNMKDQVSKQVDEHGEQVGQGVDKAGDLLDERTGGQYADRVDQGQDALKNGLDGLDGQDDDIS